MELALPGDSRSGWRIRFFRAVDRYHHQIIWSEGSGPDRLVLESIEGAPGEDWPPSPPLQQLHFQEIGARPVALAVGMAGRLHWSSSISLLAEGSPIGAAAVASGLLIEQAASGRASDGWLGNTWRFPPQVEIAGSGPTSGEGDGLILTLRSRVGDGVDEALDPGGRPIRFRLSVAAGSSARVGKEPPSVGWKDREGDPGTPGQPRLLRLVPERPGPDGAGSGTTICWGLQLQRMADGDGQGPG